MIGVLRVGGTEIGLERWLEGCFMRFREACEGPFHTSRRLQAHCSLCLTSCRCAMSLGSRVRLWAVQLKTNQSTFSGTRSLSWRSGPV